MGEYKPFGDNGPRLGPPRQLTTQEVGIVSRLLKLADSGGFPDFPNAYLAMEYLDNLPGSIHLVKSSEPTKKRSLGKSISVGSFTDIDSVYVQITLDADSDGDLYDLDIWKVNDQAIEQWPDSAAIVKNDSHKS